MKLDTKIPDLKIDNKNIDFIADWKTADSDDGDEVVGTIRTRDGMVNLAGTIEDLQDGWFLYINDNMVDNVVHLGEFGQQYHNNKRNWTYSQQMAHNDYVKLKVEDNMKNAREYIFKVIVDPEIKDELPLSLPMKKSESKKSSSKLKSSQSQSEDELI